MADVSRISTLEKWNRFQHLILAQIPISMTEKEKKKRKRGKKRKKREKCPFICQSKDFWVSLFFVSPKCREPFYTLPLYIFFSLFLSLFSFFLVFFFQLLYISLFACFSFFLSFFFSFFHLGSFSTNGTWQSKEHFLKKGSPCPKISI